MFHIYTTIVPNVLITLYKKLRLFKDVDSDEHNVFSGYRTFSSRDFKLKAIHALNQYYETESIGAIVFQLKELATEIESCFGELAEA